VCDDRAERREAACDGDGSSLGDAATVWAEVWAGVDPAHVADLSGAGEAVPSSRGCVLFENGGAVVSAEWQKIGGIELCEGLDGVVGIVWGAGYLSKIDPTGDILGGYVLHYRRDKAKAVFEESHCQPRHRLIECADGAVMVLSVDEVDGKPRRGAIVRQNNGGWIAIAGEEVLATKFKDEAIAAAVAYVTAR
jgi:hypothetical protein